VLKPGGFCLAYIGTYWKYDTLLQLGQHLTYFIDYVTVMAEENSILWPRRTICRHKSIVALVKGEGKPRCNVLSVWIATGADKRYHLWEQDERTARYPTRPLLDPNIPKRPRGRPRKIPRVAQRAVSLQ
jgi:hypothetical protein